MTSFPVILSAPSGAGKTTIAERIVSARPDVGYSISATTRARRDYEVHGKEYFFLSQGEFESRRNAGDFAESAEVHGRWYGTLKEEIARLTGLGQHTLLDIDVQGARSIRAAFPNSVLIFILPPSLGEMLSRLRGRATDADESIRIRLRTAMSELTAVEEYDYAVINDDLDRATAAVSRIIDSEGSRVRQGVLASGRVAKVLEELRGDMFKHI